TVPTTLTSVVSAGDSIERCTEASAAWWKTTDAPSQARRQSSLERMSPWSQSRRPGSFRARSASRFYDRPVERSSRMQTSFPSRSRRSAMWDPMKPAPPVTTYRSIESEPPDAASPPALHGVPRVDDGASVARDHRIVEDLVRGRDDHAVRRAERARGQALGGEPLAAVLDRGHVGVDVGYVRALLLEDLDDVERGRLTHVVDIRLVGDAQDQHLGA